jgi:hypothetical protein
MLSMVGDVPIDNEASVVTSSTSRFAGLTWFFGGAHRDRVCVRSFAEMSVYSCLRVELDLGKKMVNYYYFGGQKLDL